MVLKMAYLVNGIVKGKNKYLGLYVEMQGVQFAPFRSPIGVTQVLYIDFEVCAFLHNFWRIPGAFQKFEAVYLKRDVVLLNMQQSFVSITFSNELRLSLATIT